MLDDWLVAVGVVVLMASLFHLVQGHWTDSMQWLCISLLALVLASDRRS